MQLNYFANGGHIDRRGHQRVDIDLFSFFFTEGRATPAQVKDLSLTGLRFETVVKLALRTELDMLLKLDISGRGRHMRISGEVIREVPLKGNSHQYGVMFHQLSWTDLVVIDEYLYQKISPMGAAS